MSELKKIRVPDLKKMKQHGDKIVMLTAYDATMARLIDQAGVDVLLVGDSLGMVILGHKTTVPVTLEDILYHTKAVARGANRSLVVADMPFMTYQISIEETLRNATRLIQEGGASAVKIEGGRMVTEAVRRLVDAGIPVMGHLGLQPQSIHKLGAFRKQAKTGDAAENLFEDAHALEKSGAFALVLEAIPKEVAREATSRLRIPTIGIGAGPHCDGQVLVSYDALGIYDEFVPTFVKQYAHLGRDIRAAVANYAEDIRKGRFPEQNKPIPISASKRLDA
ncbi:MAG: 3-methyl-2-oxobutanoate hydroxymethyltransferase [Solibacterales bacterium]|nr:3-methyl-2-oxobutanoate hydroxymethyltransferase [Bryobacterales bacterium]|tara:strand:- start:6234 stop:7070 length:837 start_codon:yes stop_codon:yes gene_type:complete